MTTTATTTTATTTKATTAAATTTTTTTTTTTRPWTGSHEHLNGQTMITAMRATLVAMVLVIRGGYTVLMCFEGLEIVTDEVHIIIIIPP